MLYKASRVKSIMRKDFAVKLSRSLSLIFILGLLFAALYFPVFGKLLELGDVSITFFLCKVTFLNSIAVLASPIIVFVTKLF